MKHKTLMILLLIYANKIYTHKTVVVLNPNGTKDDPGRVIDTSFERELTQKCCNFIKNSLEAHNKYLTIIINTNKNQIETASFVNRMETTFYLFISFYYTIEARDECSFYYYNLDSQSENFNSFNTQQLTFVPFEKASLKHLKSTKKIATTLQNILKKNNSSMKNPSLKNGPINCLIGINTPALACEFGIKNNTDWQKWALLLSQALQELIAQGLI